MARRERDILEQAVQAVAEQATKANDLVDDLIWVGGTAGPIRSSPTPRCCGWNS
jgi:hypothetical protein